MRFTVLLLVSLLFASCYTSKNPLKDEMKELRQKEVAEDTSFIYSLPFEKGKAFRVIQGYFSQFSHKERAALDFNMKPGTKVLAARGGIVLRMKEDGDRGGFRKKYRPYGNYIVIEHEDGSRAGYWHLQKDGVFVQPGDTVQTGQVIGLSGQTGYAAVPHLHFLVWKSGNGRKFQQVPTRFHTSRGVRYLSFWGKYRNN